jgi:hypothetical protein
MPVVHLSQIQIEYLRSQMAGLVVPPFGEQDAPNVQKERVDEPGWLHLSPPLGVATSHSQHLR